MQRITSLQPIHPTRRWLSLRIVQIVIPPAPGCPLNFNIAFQPLDLFLRVPMYPRIASNVINPGKSNPTPGPAPPVAVICLIMKASRIPIINQALFLLSAKHVTLWTPGLQLLLIMMASSSPFTVGSTMTNGMIVHSVISIPMTLPNSLVLGQAVIASQK